MMRRVCSTWQTGALLAGTCAAGQFPLRLGRATAPRGRVRVGWFRPHNCQCFLCFRAGRLLSMAARALALLTMSDTPKPPPLAELRAQIDRIDATMHRLLMDRGEIIGRLIDVKRTSETGSAFRPAREA